MDEAAPRGEAVAKLRTPLPAAADDSDALDEPSCDWAGDVAAYSLGALEPEGDAAVEEHLTACTTCADDLDWMVSVAALLAAAVASGLVDPETMRPAGRNHPREARIA